MNNQEQFQNEVLKDFKYLIKELSEIKTFSGLMMHQQKIQNLYEKYIFLKQLNNLKYQQILEPVSSQSPVPSELQNEDSAVLPSVNEIDIPEIVNPVAEKEEIIEPEEKSNEEESNKDFQLPQDAKDTQETSAENIESEDEEKLTPLHIKIAEIKPHEKKKNLEPIHLDFNDSIAFISQLFNGSKADMDKELAVLNNTQTIEEAKKWMEEMFHTYNWKNKEEFVERLSGLIINRFEL